MSAPAAARWRSSGCARCGAASAVAIERDPERCARIERNAQRLGTPELVVAQGSAPAALDGLPPPDAVFIGGGLSEPGLLERCWQALPQGGRLVANAVTLEGEQALLAWRARLGGELVRIDDRESRAGRPVRGLARRRCR